MVAIVERSSPAAPPSRRPLSDQRREAADAEADALGLSHGPKISTFLIADLDRAPAVTV